MAAAVHPGHYRRPYLLSLFVLPIGAFCIRISGVRLSVFYHLTESLFASAIIATISLTTARSGRSTCPRQEDNPRKSGSHWTRRWREKDSNPRSPARETTLRDCLLIEEVRFAADSPLEERVSSEPVSEVGFPGLAIRDDSERFMDDNRSGKRLFRARKRRNFSLCPLAASPAISILNC
jgi:hypothetical protein